MIMNRFVKNRTLFVLGFACFTGSVGAFPHTIIFENKTDKVQKIFINSAYTIKGIPYKRTRSLEQTLSARESFVFGSKNHLFTTLIIKISDGQNVDDKLYGSLVTGLGTISSVAKIELLNNGQFKISAASYWQQAKLSTIAAKKAAAQRFANTRAWFSGIWESITTAFARFFTRNAPVETTGTSVPSTSEQNIPQVYEPVSWSDVTKGKLGTEYTQKVMDIINTDYKKARLSDLNKQLKDYFFKRNPTGKALPIQLSNEDAKNKIDLITRILDVYRQKGIVK